MVLKVPQARYFDDWFIFTGLQVHWAQKEKRNWEKKSKISILGQFSALDMTISRAKNGSDKPNLVLFLSWEGHWDMQRCFQMFVDAIKAI